MNPSKKLIWGLFFLCACLVCGIPVKSSAGTLAASDFIDKLEMNGDLRIRYEYKEKDVSDEDKVDRLRQRFRLGMKWNNPEENWKIAAGLATGPKDATSTDTTYSETTFFETGNINLDYAYAEHKMNDFKFLAGQQKNPFVTSWLLWDSDVRPAGFTGQFARDIFFATAGWYQARYLNNDIAQMDAIQVGTKFEMASVALAFYNYHRTDEILADLEITGIDDDYKYQIIDCYAAGNFKMDPADIKPYAQVFYNAGAKGEEGQSVQGGNLDPEEENLGWVVGIEGKIERFSVDVSYAEVGADSCVQGLKESTFGSDLKSTDIKGFKVGLGYQLTKNCWLAATGFFYEPKERDLDQKPKTYQFDLNYKF